jgi:hypothetical protein
MRAVPSLTQMSPLTYSSSTGAPANRNPHMGNIAEGSCLVTMKKGTLCAESVRVVDSIGRT